MKEEKMIVIGMYADQTGLYTEDELSKDNWCDLYIPERIVRQWYEENDLAKETAKELGIPIEEATFERWLNEVCWGEDTDGLFQFALDNGSLPITGVNKPDYVFYRDENGFKTIVFEGDYDECRYYGRALGWELGDNKLEMWEP